jgi:hypothetical protein
MRKEAPRMQTSGLHFAHIRGDRSYSAAMAVRPAR